MIEDRLWSKIRVHPLGCWEWTGAIHHGGYGVFWDGGRTVRAHRVAYTLWFGPIPDGLDIDHLCRNRACVNPMHLEPVTRAENLRRGRNANREKTHCPRGHAYTLKNTSFWKVGRVCKTCRGMLRKARS